MRAVIDTNVFISAILFKGKATNLVKLWKKGALTVLISKEVLEEYIKTLSYPKFRLSELEIEYIIEKELFPYTEVIKVKSKVSAVKEDREDDKFLALALDGKADYIISGDKHLLKLKKFREIPITSISSFLEKLKRK